MILRNLRSQNAYVHFAITGGGTGVIPRLLDSGGASGSFSGCNIPYSKQGFDDFAKGWDKKYCSFQAAEVLAIASLQQAFRGVPEDKIPVGVGVTCSLTTGPGERIGRKNRAFVSIITPFGRFSAMFDNFQTCDRHQQEDEVVRFIEESIRYEFQPMSSIFNLPNKVCVFPGSFNPCHEGHLKIIEAARKEFDFVVPELTFDHFDKDSPTPSDIFNRYDVFNWCFLSNKRRFVKKAEFIKRFAPQTELCFVCGMDTWEKISDEDKANIDAQFIVVDRNGKSPKMMPGLPLHPATARIKINSPISSTQIREQNSKND